MTLNRCTHELYDLEGAIRALLVSRGKTDTSTQACQEYARRFIARRVKGWKPGKPLRGRDAERVGAAFLRAVGWRIRNKEHYLGRPTPHDD